ncbi:MULTISPECIES: hypothetical protein [unclassified Candidatus Tisiphia]|uniref:hypothetical protein n=1 Tax=unclassified Candidatus Tisiphia TaxID=2996318 RepID=UPI00312C7286
MIYLQLLNTLLFSDNKKNLEKAVNLLNNPNDPRQGNLTKEQVSEILSYAVECNPNLTAWFINDAFREQANKNTQHSKLNPTLLTDVTINPQVNIPTEEMINNNYPKC